MKHWHTRNGRFKSDNLFFAIAGLKIGPVKDILSSPRPGLASPLAI